MRKQFRTMETRSSVVARARIHAIKVRPDPPRADVLHRDRNEVWSW
jgi:hypothetical protein